MLLHPDALWLAVASSAAEINSCQCHLGSGTVSPVGEKLLAARVLASACLSANANLANGRSFFLAVRTLPPDFRKAHPDVNACAAVTPPVRFQIERHSFPHSSDFIRLQPLQGCVFFRSAATRSPNVRTETVK